MGLARALGLSRFSKILTHNLVVEHGFPSGLLLNKTNWTWRRDINILSGNYRPFGFSSGCGVWRGCLANSIQLHAMKKSAD